MGTKYDNYLASEGCAEILSSEYRQFVYNIIDDDETYISETMKIAFFDYLEKYDKSVSIVHYCDGFFDQPIGSDLKKKKYLLKGKSVEDSVYQKELGRVTSKTAFTRSLSTTAKKKAAVDISALDDDYLLDTLLASPNEIGQGLKRNNFLEFLNDADIAGEKVQVRPMWTFDGYFDDDVFKGYDIKKLPCVLGLPGPDRTAKDYDKIDRLAFSLKITRDISVKKPTSFDAGVMPVWCGGGHTKVHVECESEFGAKGFEEYVHESITYQNITSEIISL